MATNKDKNKTMETLKGNNIIDFDHFIDTKHRVVDDFKRQFKREWNANHEKVALDMESRVKQLENLREELLELVYKDDEEVWKRKPYIQIVIGEEDTE